MLWYLRLPGDVGRWGTKVREHFPLCLLYFLVFELCDGIACSEHYIKFKSIQKQLGSWWVTVHL